MAGILWVMGLFLLMQGCWSSPEQTDSGCMKWTKRGENVCCDACYPGNRLVKSCGPDPKQLCKPCESGRFTVNPKHYSCDRCTQCVGAQVYLKNCTPTSDTKCGCKEGLTCGDQPCSYCVEQCAKGQEPTDDGSCRPCPEGFFNDKLHQKCKPWSKTCPKPDQEIEVKGDAVSDIKCADVRLSSVITTKEPVLTDEKWTLALSVTTCVVFMAFTIIVIILVAVKFFQKRKKPEVEKKPITKTPVIRTPTDDPRTLIAIECSFHEAQQEQGSSSESLNSKESSEQLIP